MVEVCPGASGQLPRTPGAPGRRRTATPPLPARTGPKEAQAMRRQEQCCGGQKVHDSEGGGHKGRRGAATSRAQR